MSTGPIVLKFGGELLEDRSRLAIVVSAIARSAKQGVGLVVVHGAGKEIDAALKAAGIEKRQVDGLRITDDATLEIVVAVLAGAVNTRFVAALGAAGVRAAGLTGADAACGVSEAGAPAPLLDRTGIEQLVSAGTATAGMIAKLRACEQAIAAGVGDVLILDGRDGPGIEAAATGAVPPNATRIVPMMAPAR